MTRRSPFVRFFTLAWASLQLAAPALSSIADGRLELNNASRPTTHVEATTGESCPVVHSPDCGVCRYLSTSGADDSAAPRFDWRQTASSALIGTSLDAPGSVAIALPHGRAPPHPA